MLSGKNETLVPGRPVSITLNFRNRYARPSHEVEFPGRASSLLRGAAGAAMSVIYMMGLTELAKALHRVYNDVEEAQAQRFYDEHARDEWENLASAEKELWT